MRHEIAERVLSRVAPPEQAATILGDLLEAQPDPVTFWLSVLKTTASIASQPRRVFVWFFTFAYGLSFFACSGWILMRMPKKLGLFAFVIPSMLWGGVASLLRIRVFSENAFSLSFAIWWFWLEKYYYRSSTAFAVATALGMWVFDGWMRQRRRRKNETSKADPPIAG